MNMKKWYVASFRYSESVYCTNLCLADSKKQAEEYYKGYKWASVRPAEGWEVETYKRRGMPIVTLGGEGDNNE